MCDILLQLTLIKKTFPKSHMHVFLELQKTEVWQIFRVCVHSPFWADLFPLMCFQCYVECSSKYTQRVTPVGGLLNLGPNLAVGVLKYAWKFPRIINLE